MSALDYITTGLAAFGALAGGLALLRIRGKAPPDADQMREAIAKRRLELEDHE
jgi:hypothetical protein